MKKRLMMALATGSLVATLAMVGGGVASAHGGKHVTPPASALPGLCISAGLYPNPDAADAADDHAAVFDLDCEV